MDLKYISINRNEKEQNTYERIVEVKFVRFGS